MRNAWRQSMQRGEAMNRAAWIGLVKLLVVAASAGLVWLAFVGYGEQQYQAGELAERSTWLQRDNSQLQEANARIATLQQTARDKEHAHGQEMAAIGTKHQEDLDHVRTEKNRVIDGLRARNLRLRIPVISTASAACSGVDTSGEAGASAGQRDGEETAELSGAAAEFLVELTSEADDVAWQLSACQAVVETDRQQQEGQ